MWKPCFVFLFLSGFSQKMHQISSQNGSQKKHHKMMPLGTQNHPKMHQNSMFFLCKTPNCANKVILGRVVFLAIFWVAIFPVFGEIWSQNWVLGKKNVRPTFTLFRPFWRSKPFFCGRRLFYRFFSQKDQKNAKIRSESTENTIEFDPNSSENSMPGSKWAGGGSALPLQLFNQSTNWSINLSIDRLVI